MKHRSRSLAAVLTALAAQGACSVYGPEDLPTAPGGASNGGKVSETSGGRSSSGGGGSSLGGTPAGGAGEGGGDAGSDFGGSASGGALTGGAGSSAGGAPGGAGAGGAGAGGTAPAGGGSGGTSSGGMSTVAPELIDNMEDLDNRLWPQLGRDGYWYTSADSAGATVDPAPAAIIVMVNLPTGESGAGGDSKRAFRFTVKGSTSTSSSAWGALGGFDFVHVNAGMKQPYDGHAYKGIRFWAKATPKVTVHVRVPLKDTSADAIGSKCGTKCDDHYLKQFEFTPTWTEYVVPWTALSQQSWGMPVAFDATTLIGVQFVVPPMLSGEVWIDDVSFIPE